MTALRAKDPETAKLRIAFYGGMANNCYVLASQMHALGLDVLYIRDRLDNYAMSQPIWEDQRLTLTYDELASSAGWTPKDWDAVAAREGWQAPDWIVDPWTHPDEVEPDPRYVLPDTALSSYIPGEDHFRRIMALMRSCDLVVVSNLHAALHALLSGRAFVVLPAGGEFVVAAGGIKAEGEAAAILARQAKLVIIAFQKAKAILSSASFLSYRYLTGGLWLLLRNYGSARFKRVSLPFSTRPQLTPAEKRTKLDALTARLGVAPVTTRFSVFVPSRVDYHWKGQDRILAALDMAQSPQDFTFIFAGWGADYRDFIAKVGDRPNFRILNCALSKPLVYDFGQASDLVIDQFMVGHIGTAAHEAAAAGAPVMAWIAKGPFSVLRLRPDMPVLHAKTPRDIARWLDRISTGRVSLPQLGAAAQSWIKAYASPKKMAEVLRQCAAGGR